MKTLISIVKPTENVHLEIVDSNTGEISLTEKVAKVVPSQEHINTFICVFPDGSKATVIYWKRCCD